MYTFGVNICLHLVPYVCRSSDLCVCCKQGAIQKREILHILVIIFGVNMLTPGSVCVGYLLFVNAELFKFGQRAVSEYNRVKLHAF